MSDTQDIQATQDAETARVSVGSTGLFGVDDFPPKCPSCGTAKADGFVDGYYGWDCGSKSVTHHAMGPARIRFSQSINCAVIPWRKRALKAEWLLSLIDPPNDPDQRPPGARSEDKEKAGATQKKSSHSLK